MRARLPAAPLAAALSLALVLPLPAAVPPYSPKPMSWRSNLVTAGHQSVSDAQLAVWIAKAQTAAMNQYQKSFSLLGIFTQCYSGGFLEELRVRMVANYTANSACRYYQAASYNGANHSYYAHAWQNAAMPPPPPPPPMPAPPPPTDLVITDRAYAQVQVVNRDAHLEEAQYQPGNVMGVPIATAGPRYAILFVGLPEAADVIDVNEIHARLTGAPYHFNAMDIRVLFGNYNNGQAPGAAVGWTSAGHATALNLHDAFNVWLLNKIQNQVGPTAQVVLWTGDHGNVEFPITISVDAASEAENGDVKARRTANQPVGNVVYEAGIGRTTTAWEEMGGADVDAVSFGDDFMPHVYRNEPAPPPMPAPPAAAAGALPPPGCPFPNCPDKPGWDPSCPSDPSCMKPRCPLPNCPGSPDWDPACPSDPSCPDPTCPPEDPGCPQAKERAVVYFSVDRPSVGLAGSDVHRERRLRPARSAAPDVFIRTTGDSNRQTFDGGRQFGLTELDNMGNTKSDVDALSLRDISFLVRANNHLSRPMFFSLRGSSRVRVYDPDGMNGGIYDYYDFATHFAMNAPRELDALALLDDGQRRLDPMTNKMRLWFDPTADMMFFSVGRNEMAMAMPWNGFKACDIIVWGPNLPMNQPQRRLTCRQLGLADEDNVDALDLGAGPNGEPRPYHPSRPLPPPPPEPPPSEEVPPLEEDPLPPV